MAKYNDRMGGYMGLNGPNQEAQAIGNLIKEEREITKNQAQAFHKVITTPPNGSGFASGITNITFNINILSDDPETIKNNIESIIRSIKK